MNILTFDIEDWFHILDNASTKSEENWSNYTSRMDQNMEKIFQLLDRHQQKATFFILGWVAEKHPQFVQQIADNGFEIASHSYSHQLVYEQNKAAFKEDLKRSIRTLEDITGKKVNTYRAPGFSITEETRWAFESLIEEGITTDSSIFPSKRGHGGYPSYGSAEPSIIDIDGHLIKEFPINTTKFLGKDIIFSGGGYFRLAPYSLINQWTRKSPYVMTYFHPRDFDPDQPMLKDLALHRKFKSYVGLRGCQRKLDKWLKDFDFVDIEAASAQVDWNQAKIIRVR